MSYIHVDDWQSQSLILNLTIGGMMPVKTFLIYSVIFLHNTISNIIIPQKIIIYILQLIWRKLVPGKSARKYSKYMYIVYMIKAMFQNFYGQSPPCLDIYRGTNIIDTFLSSYFELCQSSLSLWGSVWGCVFIIRQKQYFPQKYTFFKVLYIIFPPLWSIDYILYSNIWTYICIHTAQKEWNMVSNRILKWKRYTLIRFSFLWCLTREIEMWGKMYYCSVLLYCVQIRWD
jgi:hypothetical protein